MPAINPQTFQRRGEQFVSQAIDQHNLSPVYVIAAAARRVTQASDRTLHDDYGHATFERLAWLTGAYGEDVRITPRQALDQVEIGARLLAQCRAELEPREVAAIEWLTRAVETALPSDVEEGPAPKNGDHGTCAAPVGRAAEGTAVCGYEITLRTERTVLMADGTDGRGQPGGRLVQVWRHTDVAIDHMHAAQLGGPA